MLFYMHSGVIQQFYAASAGAHGVRMAIEKKPARMSSERLNHLADLAIRHYELNQSVDDLAADIGVDQSTITRRLSRARKEGLVHTLVVPPLDYEHLTNLEQDVRYQFDLEDVVLVRGRADLLDTEEESAAREALVLSIAQAAARYLERFLTSRDTLLVPWGRMVHYIARQLRPPGHLPDLTVIPMVGLFGLEDHPFESNVLASHIASLFGGRSILLAAPAVVEKGSSRMIESLPLVQRVKALYEQATVAIVPLASPDPEDSTVVRMGLLEGDAVRDLISRGAVGEVASWWFDRNGSLVEDRANHVIGLGLDGLSRMVSNRARVIAVVGANRDRIPPLKVALTHGLVNTLITDHITAKELLRES